jgi:hypothetical protein
MAGVSGCGMSQSVSLRTCAQRRTPILAVCVIAGRRHVGALPGLSVQTHQHGEQGAVRAHESHCCNAQFQVMYDLAHIPAYPCSEVSQVPCYGHKS